MLLLCKDTSKRITKHNRLRYWEDNKRRDRKANSIRGDMKKVNKKKNSYEFNPQQLEFISNYFNPDSETFGNLTQSGSRAGFTPTYSENLLSLAPKWFQKAIEIYSDEEMLQDARTVLKDTLKMEVISHVKMGDDVVIKTDPQLLKIKQDTAKFVAETIGKDKFSKRHEHTGKNGERLTISFDSAFKKDETSR